MKEIEIALIHFGKADNRIHRTESRAHRKVSSAFFINPNHKVLVPGNRWFSWFRPRVHLLEILQTFKPLFADLDPNHIEYFPGRNCQLPSNDFVLRLGVPANLDLFYV